MIPSFPALYSPDEKVNRNDDRKSFVKQVIDYKYDE